MKGKNSFFSKSYGQKEKNNEIRTTFGKSRGFQTLVEFEPKKIYKLRKQKLKRKNLLKKELNEKKNFK